MLPPSVIRAMDFGGGNACSVEEYAFLASLIYLQKPRAVLEIGTSTGIGALVMAAAGNADGHACRVVSIDIPFGSRTFADGLAANWTTVEGVRPGTTAAIELVTGDSREVLPRFALDGRRFDVIFIDGDHTDAGVEADWQHALALGPETIVLHDTVHHRSVAQLVERLGPEFGGMTLTYPPGWQGATQIRDVGFSPGAAGGAGDECPGLTVFTRVARVAEARARFRREHAPSGHEIAQKLNDQGILAPVHLDQVYDGFGFRHDFAPAPLVHSNQVLEIVLTGRNDGFGGDDFNERMFTAAGFNHRNLTEAGVTHRFTLVEWNPSPDRPLLAEIVRARLPWWGDCLVVDPAWHEKLSENPRLQFMEFFAKNVGVRRSTADWILTSNTDIFCSRDIVQRIAHGRLVPGTLYRACRIDVDRHIPWHEPSWALFEDARHHLRTHDLEPPYFSNAAGDFLLLDRASYHRLGGFNERVRFAKIYKDGQFCIQAHAHGMPIEVLGPIHHLDHEGSFITATEKYGPNHALAPFGPWWDASLPYSNRDDWGLSAAVETSAADHGCVRLHTPETHGPALSVVVPGHSIAAWLTASVDGLLAASEDLEVLVVDPSSDARQAWGPTPPARVRFVEGSDDAMEPGRTASRRRSCATRSLNQGLALARGRLLCCLSTPAAADRDSLTRLLARFDTEPGLDALACAYQWRTPDDSSAGSRQPAENSPFFVFRRRVYEALERLDEVSGTPQYDLWLRIARTAVVDADASIVFDVWPQTGGAPWLTQPSAEETWSRLRVGGAATTREPIPGALVADYARRKQCLYDALREQLQARLPEGTREIAIWEVDATTPLVVQAAQDLGVHVAAVFTRDASRHDAHIGGAPVKPARHELVPEGMTIVLTMPSLVDRAALYRVIPSTCIIALVVPTDLPAGAPYEREMWGPLVEARWHRREGRPADELRAYRALGRLDVPPGALLEAATAAAEAGELPLAIKLSRRVLRGSPAHAVPLIYQVGSLLKRYGDAAGAERHFAQLAGREDIPPHYAGGASFHLGELALQRGDAETARTHLVRARALLPGHAKAGELLALIDGQL